ncbi:MAG: hypothetical protein ACK5YY_00535 [Alphaproteobacteria bacterium]|jgi:hypothetical protein|nr:hypothetical protein [Alphaproteobacteria bacterium]
MLPDTPMTTIALYDYPAGSADLKAFWRLMMDFSEKTGIPWGSIGLGGKAKYLTFKGGFSRVIKNDLSGLQAQERVSLLGGVSEAGTSSDWQVSASITKENTTYIGINNYTTYFSFPSRLIEEKRIDPQELLKEFLACAPFQYGIMFDMCYVYVPNAYAYGGLVNVNHWDHKRNDLIHKWSNVYGFSDGTYRTGLLRDVYPHNILVDTHLNERVGHTTLGAWIEKDPVRGTLEKLTDAHWLWSLTPDQIPPVQEVLQDAGLLLCYQL